MTDWLVDTLHISENFHIYIYVLCIYSNLGNDGREYFDASVFYAFFYFFLGKEKKNGKKKKKRRKILGVW
jgi:hypothetical protein